MYFSLRVLQLEVTRIIRADFYFNALVGLVFNSKFSSLVVTYYFLMRMGISYFLNTGWVSSLGHLMQISTHRPLLRMATVLKTSASMLLFIVALAL